jgi:hypothetical protein
MSKAWMNTFNVVRTASRPFCDWDVEAIIKIRGRWENEARDKEEPEPYVMRMGGEEPDIPLIW